MKRMSTLFRHDHFYMILRETNGAADAYVVVDRVLSVGRSWAGNQYRVWVEEAPSLLTSVCCQEPWILLGEAQQPDRRGHGQERNDLFEGETFFGVDWDFTLFGFKNIGNPNKNNRYRVRAQQSL